MELAALRGRIQWRSKADGFRQRWAPQACRPRSLYSHGRPQLGISRSPHKVPRQRGQTAGGGAVLGPRVGSGLWLACCHLTPRNGLSTCTQQRVQLPVRPARCLLPLGRRGRAVPRPGTRVPPRLKTASGRDAAADLGRQGRDVLRWNDGQRRWRE